MAKYTEEELKEELENSEYKYGFYTDIESDTFPKGLSEEVVIALSKKKNEPQWMTDWRLSVYGRQCQSHLIGQISSLKHQISKI